MSIGERDTSDAVEALFRNQVMARSAEERFRMACDMFDAATALITASLAPDIAADPQQRRIAVLERLYWSERNEPAVRLAIETLKQRCRSLVA